MKSKFPFSDLHSFKDFVGFVALCAPNDFPIREGVPPEEQWTLDLAFQALRDGLALSVREKGERREFAEARKHIDEAYGYYVAGQERDGFKALDNARKLLRRDSVAVDLLSRAELVVAEPNKAMERTGDG